MLRVQGLLRILQMIVKTSYKEYGAKPEKVSDKENKSFISTAEIFSFGPKQKIVFSFGLLYKLDTKMRLMELWKFPLLDRSAAWDRSVAYVTDGAYPSAA